MRRILPEESPHFFNEESFVCVSVETPLEADSDTAFLDRAVDFANEQLWGTLAASITLPPGFRKDPRREAALQSAFGRLDYGTIAINQWSGLSFAMMSPAWGGVAGSRLEDAQSGIGWVHNTSMLDGIEKNVLTGPLTVSPKPMWFATHSNPEAVAWRLLYLYHKPSVWNLAGLLGIRRPLRSVVKSALAADVGWDKLQRERRPLLLTFGALMKVGMARFASLSHPTGSPGAVAAVETSRRFRAGPRSHAGAARGWLRRCRGWPGVRSRG